MPEYFSRPEIPGQKYFECAPLRGSLSVQSCAQRWRAANPAGRRPDPMNRCSGCKTGAEHAGEKVVEVSPIQSGKICSRCLRNSGRLIHGVLDVSCFNRELEVIKGRNAKGLPPVKHPPLGAFSVLYAVPGHPPRARRHERVTGATEAMVSMVHRCGPAVRFGFAGSPRVTWVQEVLL